MKKRICEISIVADECEKCVEVALEDTMLGNQHEDLMKLCMLSDCLSKSLKDDKTGKLRAVLQHLLFVMSVVASRDAQFNETMSDCIKTANNQFADNILKENGIEGIEIKS